MKKSLLPIGLMLALAPGARAALVDYFNNSGAVIPDNSTVGITQTILASDPGTTISTVNVLLNLNGGFNGDFYGYLVYNDGNSIKTEILLNRMGGGSNPLSGSGFGAGTVTANYAGLLAVGVSLVDGGANGNIHGALPGAGNPVPGGPSVSYLPDSGSTLNGTFGGMSGSGTWTLFMSDLSAGGQGSLVSWGLEINAVPEPVNVALGIFGGLIGTVALVRRYVAARRA